MSNVISVYSTVAQAEGFDVEIRDTTLLSSRYFPTTEGDEFAGKEVLFDFESSDLAKGAFLTSGYKSGNTVAWIANSVVPPRVGDEDSVDPTDQDRRLFERLCRAQGADLNRADAYQNLLNIKAARLAARTDRAKELLAALVLKEGKIEFDQDKDATGAETDHIVCKFYDPAKGADNHYIAANAWSSGSAHPYDDVCAMLNEGMKHGRKYKDLLLGANAWAYLSNDDKFLKFAGNTYHSDGMVIDFGDVDGAQHVASAVFNGVRLDVIVYGGAYKDAEGALQQFIDPNAAILISEGIGRGLQGGCTLLNPNSLGYGIENSFVGMTGTHIMSIFKDFNNQKLYIREESRPLPAPKHSVNEWDWIYCDTSMSITNGAFGEVAKGISFDQDEDLTWATDCACAATAVVAGEAVSITVGTVTSKTVKLYAVKDGKPSGDALTVSSGKIVVPADNDRDVNDKFIIYATAVA